MVLAHRTAIGHRTHRSIRPERSAWVPKAARPAPGSSRRRRPSCGSATRPAPTHPGRRARSAAWPRHRRPAVVIATTTIAPTISSSISRHGSRWGRAAIRGAPPQRHHHIGQVGDCQPEAVGRQADRQQPANDREGCQRPKQDDREDHSQDQHDQDRDNHEADVAEAGQDPTQKEPPGWVRSECRRPPARAAPRATSGRRRPR